MFPNCARVGRTVRKWTICSHQTGAGSNIDVLEGNYKGDVSEMSYVVNNEAFGKA